MVFFLLCHVALAAIGLSHFPLASVVHLLAAVGLYHLPLAAVVHGLVAVGLPHLPLVSFES